jgi:hypothetical protein
MRISSKNIVVFLLGACLLLTAFCGCATSRPSSEARAEAEFIPDLKLSQFSYVRTDIALDGGTVAQLYQDSAGQEYTLAFPPKKSTSSSISWVTPDGHKYSLARRENQNVLADFLTGISVRYRDDREIFEDIRHALLLIGGLPAPELWNFSSAEKNKSR